MQHPVTLFKVCGETHKVAVCSGKGTKSASLDFCNKNTWLGLGKGHGLGKHIRCVTYVHKLSYVMYVT